MTKVRPPLTIDAALARIAGQLPGSWGEMAVIAGRGERHVRKWGDHDAPEQIPLDCAIAFDLAYQRAGGIGAPIHDVYALLLETGRSETFADQVALTKAAIAGIKENAEAAQAQLACTLPGATPHAAELAVRETEEAIACSTHTLALLRKSAGLSNVERGPGGDVDA